MDLYVCFIIVLAILVVGELCERYIDTKYGNRQNRRGDDSEDE